MNGFKEAAEAFKADAALTDDDIESIKAKRESRISTLEIRWTRAITAPAKQHKYEEKIKELEKKIATYEAIGVEGGGGGAAAAAAGLINAKKNTGVFPKVVKFDLLGHRSSITCVQFHPFLK